jgi:hypothetical protein
MCELRSFVQDKRGHCKFSATKSLGLSKRSEKGVPEEKVENESVLPHVQ